MTRVAITTDKPQKSSIHPLIPSNAGNLPMLKSGISISTSLHSAVGLASKNAASARSIFRAFARIGRHDRVKTGEHARDAELMGVSDLIMFWKMFFILFLEKLIVLV
jgi:hypothetical protein